MHSQQCCLNRNKKLCNGSLPGLYEGKYCWDTLQEATKKKPNKVGLWIASVDNVQSMYSFVHTFKGFSFCFYFVFDFGESEKWLKQVSLSRFVVKKIVLLLIITSK